MDIPTDRSGDIPLSNIMFKVISKGKRHYKTSSTRVSWVMVELKIKEVQIQYMYMTSQVI